MTLSERGIRACECCDRMYAANTGTDTVTTASSETPEPNPSHQSVEEVVASLRTDVTSGLSGEEPALQLQRHGHNELTATKPVAAWRRFLAQFQDVLVILLLVATASPPSCGRTSATSPLPVRGDCDLRCCPAQRDPRLRSGVRAEAAVAALRAMSAADATVVRDGARRSVAAADLVPGDIILIEEGDTIPADGRLVRIQPLSRLRRPRSPARACPFPKTPRRSPRTFRSAIATT